MQEHINAMAKEGQEAPQLSEQDTIYYLFVVHDTNGDGYLDGHELRAAFSDYEDHNNSNGGGDQVPLIPLDEVTDMVDHVLEEDDKNGE